MDFDIGLEVESLDFNLELDAKEQTLAPDFGVVQIVNDNEYPKYEGVYVVVPKVTAQRLETKDRYLTDNVEIKEIPFANVTNNAGGITVTIGG